MKVYIQVEFSLKEIEFIQLLNNAIINQSETKILEIKNIPSASKAIKLITQQWFELKVFQHKFVGIILNIDGKISELPDNLNLNTKPSILITFQSQIDNHESKIYWKTQLRDNFYSLKIDCDNNDEIVTFCLKFLIEEIKNERSGVLEKFQLKNKLRIHEIGDNNEKNLLAIAVSRCLVNIVECLVKFDFDADDLIDDAWEFFVNNTDDAVRKDEMEKIILCLLNANARYPISFDYKKASLKLKEFIRKCESLHDDVDEDNFNSLKLKLESNPNLIHFYERNNESLLAYSLRMKKFKIFELLNKQITTGSHEDLDEVYENMEMRDCKILRDQHKANAKDFPKAHILIIRSKCKIGNNDRLSHKKWKYIDEALEILNSNDYCRKILKVAAEFKKLKIYFDFKHDSTYYVDPATSIYSKGIIYEGGSIFIGAKHFKDDEKKFAVFGVLAHELCHLAVFMAFANRNFDPFPLGESDQKTRFIDQVMVQCKERAEFEKIVANVLVSYPKDVQDSEMIVTVPQMLMHYIRDPAKIQDLEGTYEELFRYSREVVEPELDRALPIFKSLRDNKKFLKFEALTESMKAKIVHSTIKFQGTETSFNELVGYDQEILKLLTSEILFQLLIKNEIIIICKDNKVTFKYGMMERNFIESRKLNEIYSKNLDGELYENFHEDVDKQSKNFEQIRNEMQNPKVFLISDHAGSGKTSILQSCVEVLRQESKYHWISYINLRKGSYIFNEFIQKNKEMKFDDVQQILMNLLNLKSELQNAIFKKLFLNGKTILLCDGFDEVCPKYSKFLKKFFTLLKTNLVKNELWISTRPHCANKLQEIFGATAYKFTPFKEETITKFISTIFKINKTSENIIDSLNIYELASGSFFRLKEDYLSQPSVLIIELLTELYIENCVALDSDDLYSIYAAIVEKQRNRLGEKVPIEDRDIFSKLSVWDVHHVLALIAIVGNDHEVELGYNLDDLASIKKWKKEKPKWTSDMIQRYGFVIVDLSDENVQNSIDFVHKTFAEFFVAQFLINFIFDDHSGTAMTEIDKIFKLIDIFILKLKEGFEIVFEIFFSYIKNEGKKLNFDYKVKLIIIGKIREILHNFDNITTDFSFKDLTEYIFIISKFVMIDHEILCKLWGLDQQETILERILDHRHIAVCDALCSEIEIIFGKNWHEIINKSETKLVTDENLENILSENYEYTKAQDMNLLKLLDLAENNFKYKTCQKMFSELDFDMISDNQILLMTFQKSKKFLDRKLFVDKCLSEIIQSFTNVERVLLFFNEIEILFDYDQEEMHKILFNNQISCLLYSIIYSTNIDEFKLIVKIYTKYQKSLEEVQDLFINWNTEQFLLSLTCPFYSEYRKYIFSIFRSEINKLRKKLENFLKGSSDLRRFDKTKLQNLNDFLNYVYIDKMESGKLFELLKLKIVDS